MMEMKLPYPIPFVEVACMLATRMYEQARIVLEPACVGCRWE